jgi:hypothetical protein
MGVQARKLAVSGGSRILDTTGALTGINASSLVAREDSVISVCTGITLLKQAYDFKVSMNWINLKKGDLLIAPDGFRINAITLTSGSLVVNLM